MTKSTIDSVMTTHEVAARFNELARQEKWFEIQDELFAGNKFDEFLFGIMSTAARFENKLIVNLFTFSLDRFPVEARPPLLNV